MANYIWPRDFTFSDRLFNVNAFSIRKLIAYVCKRIKRTLYIMKHQRQNTLDTETQNNHDSEICKLNISMNTH